MRRAILSLLHLFTVFSFFTAGGSAIALFFLPTARARVVDWLLATPEKFAVMGVVLLSSACLLLLSFSLLDRGRYLVIRMGVSVDLDLVKQAVVACFARQFQEKIVLTDLGIGDQSRLEMSVSVDKEVELSQIEKELTALLRKSFKYTKPFDLIVKK